MGKHNTVKVLGELTIFDLDDGDGLMFKNRFKLFKPMTWLASLIRLFTRSPYNHAAVVTRHNNRLFITEADYNGVHPELLETRLLSSNADEIIVLRPKQKVSNVLISLRAEQIWGKKYGESILIKYALDILLGRKLRSKTSRSGKRFVCTHAFAFVHNRPYWWRYSPKDMYLDDGFEHYFLKK